MEPVNRESGLKGSYFYCLYAQRPAHPKMHTKVECPFRREGGEISRYKKGEDFYDNQKLHEKCCYNKSTSFKKETHIMHSVSYI